MIFKVFLVITNSVCLASGKWLKKRKTKIPTEKTKNSVQTKMSFPDKSLKLSNFEYRNTKIKAIKSTGNSHKFIIRALSNLYLFSVTFQLLGYR